MTITERATSGYSLATGEDRFGKKRIIAGISQLFIKVSAQDTGGGLLLIEHQHMQKGGPPRHLHYEQDEWFYVLDGQYIVEVGAQRFQLGPGDSVFAPRRVPHAFAFVGEGTGRLLIAFQPAGKMEERFELLATQPGFGSDPSILPQFGFERVGPPLEIRSE